MGDIDISQKDPYFVAVKLFLERRGEFLILKDKFGEWDLPGGRIKKFEFETSFEDIIKRKVEEELGTEVKYSVDKMPTILMRHERVEVSPGNPTVHIFGLGYRAELLEGEVSMSDAHVELKWVNKDSFKPEEYFKEGWLKGVQEYLLLGNG